MSMSQWEIGYIVGRKDGEDQVDDLVDALSQCAEWFERHGELVFAVGGMPAVARMNSVAMRTNAALAKYEASKS